LDTVTGGAATATAFGGIAIVGNAANAATQGVWQYSTDSGSTWSTVASGGSAPSNAAAILLPTTAKLRFLPNALDFNGTPGALSIRVSDAAVAFSAATDISAADAITGQWSIATTLNTSVTAVNDAPVASGSASLAAVLEDTGAPAGSSISTLFASNFNDSKDTVSSGSAANTLLGVVITANAATSSQGKWQWLNGSTWTDIATTGLSDTTGLYLTAATSIRFLPAANFNGTPGSLTTRLVDSSASGLSNGSTINVSTHGGTSSYSAATVALSTSISAVNDAPVASGSSTLPAVTEDSTAPAGSPVSSLFSSNFNDSTDTISAAVSGGSSTNSLLGVVITANGATSAQGQWQWLNGSTWTDIATTGLSDTTGLYLSAATSIRFLPTANWNGTPGSLTTRLVDSSASGLTNGSAINVSTNGGTTAYSAATVSLSTSIAAVNDAPLISQSVFSENFNALDGNKNGGQYLTNEPVQYSASIAGWIRSWRPWATRPSCASATSGATRRA
jgi:hypothetical protein